MLPIIVAIFLALSVVGGGVVYAAENAPPTSPLHPVKEVVDNTAGSLHLVEGSEPTSTPTPVHRVKDQESVQTATPTPEPEGSDRVRPQDQDTDHPKPALTPLSTAEATAVAAIETAIPTLASNPNMPGHDGHGPTNGLEAKLDAATQAIGRGDTQAAQGILDAFARELNAMERSGHISGSSDYLTLYNDYVALLKAVNPNATPVPTVTPVAHSSASADAAGHQGRGRHDDDLSASPTPTPSSNATATPTPTPEPEGHGHGNAFGVKDHGK